MASVDAHHLSLLLQFLVTKGGGAFGVKEERQHGRALPRIAQCNGPSMMLTWLPLVAVFLVGMTVQVLQPGVVWQASRFLPSAGTGLPNESCLPRTTWGIHMGHPGLLAGPAAGTECIAMFVVNCIGKTWRARPQSNQHSDVRCQILHKAIACLLGCSWLQVSLSV